MSLCKPHITLQHVHHNNFDGMPSVAGLVTDFRRALSVSFVSFFIGYWPTVYSLDRFL